MGSFLWAPSAPLIYPLSYRWSAQIVIYMNKQIDIFSIYYSHWWISSAIICVWCIYYYDVKWADDVHCYLKVNIIKIII